MVAFVIGWPVFLIVYLVHIKDRLNEDTVIDRIGHVYKSYDERYYYWCDIVVNSCVYMEFCINPPICYGLVPGMWLKRYVSYT